MWTPLPNRLDEAVEADEGFLERLAMVYAEEAVEATETFRLCPPIRSGTPVLELVLLLDMSARRRRRSSCLSCFLISALASLL